MSAAVLQAADDFARAALRSIDLGYGQGRLDSDSWYVESAEYVPVSSSAWRCTINYNVPAGSRLALAPGRNRAATVVLLLTEEAVSAHSKGAPVDWIIAYLGYDPVQSVQPTRRTTWLVQHDLALSGMVGQLYPAPTHVVP